VDKKVMGKTKMPASKDDETSQKDINYWRSFKELYNDPDFKKARHSEFGADTIGEFDLSKLSVLSRRKFLALLSASAALAAAGCSDYLGKGEVIPYNKKPEEITLGIPNYYASTCKGCEQSCGILIKTREGRPIKLDGNPEHPVNKGKICARGQAGILDLYDPGRLKDPMFSNDRKNHSIISWQEADDRIIAELKSSSASGKEIAIIANKVVSPTQKKLFIDFIAAYPATKIYSYELTDDSNRKSAWNKCYPSKTLPSANTYPVIDWERAKVILALESDFLLNEGNTMEQIRLYTQNRDAVNGKEFNRLYSVEGAATLTGSNADYRIRLRTDAIEEFVMCLLNEFIVKKKLSSFSSDSKIISLLQKYSMDEFVKKYYLNEIHIKNLVQDLAKNQGSSIISAGNKLPESTHIAVNLLNEVLGNSRLYSNETLETELLPFSKKEEIDILINNMNSGKVGVVIHFDSDPVYHFAPDYNYSDSIKKVPLAITFSEIINDSSDVSNYILPASHMLECWSDFKTRSGIYSTQQPVIAPIYRNRQKEAALLTWVNGNKDSYNDKIYLDFIKTNWQKSIYPQTNSKLDFIKFWNTSLHDGVAFVNEKSSPLPSFNSDAFASNANKMNASTDYVVLLQDNYNLGDGRFANNGFLQELPQFISKIVWDNYAAISLQTANDLGVTTNDLIKISIESRTITVPVFIQPGIADKVIEIALGYGRTKAGIIGSGVGVNVIPLMTKNYQLSDRLYNNAKVEKVNGSYDLITTQEHHILDSVPWQKDLQEKREIIQEGIYEEYKKNPKFLNSERKKEEIFDLQKTHFFEGVKWGMSIDLNKCTGCNACVIACVVENNIPVVGKDQVKVHREMQWLRIDTYFSGPPDSPNTSFQPILCQHCDNAPCENVCPVVATNHSPDGLNQQVYNRCVGTRYCSNNCPYKVRRFNFFNYRDHVADAYYEQEPIDVMMNPEVTVRSRGVMEKCTFCIQRIMNEKQHSIEQKRDINGENVKTACQDACPSYAIEFGDVHNKENKVYKNSEHDLGYHVLEELNVRPNITYLAKLRNINPVNEHVEEKK
jgi:MoCo/4Fe-4S cofactor protein with predicted Tat translocation signal